MQKDKMSRVQTNKMMLQNGKAGFNFGQSPSNSFVGVLSSKNFQKYEVIVENEQFQNELRLIQWRSKTEFPIVKILFYKIIQKKLLNECSVVQVAIQNFPYNFNTLPKMVFYQILYILKQSLIGFQRLYDRFGSFDISPKMILINKNNKCRVWINQNITLNFPSRKGKYTENQFIVKIVRIFQEKCARTALSIELFTHMSNITKLAQAISYLEGFVRNHKIVISNRLNFNSDLTPKKNNQRYQQQEKAKKTGFGYSTFKKIPKFILNLRQERKVDHNNDSKSFDRLDKRRLVKDNSQMDLSHKKSYTPIKYTQNYSNSKSKISPKSQISQDVKKQTKSNNSQINKSNVKQFIKQNSQKCLNFQPLNLTIKKLQKKSSLKHLQASKADQFLVITPQKVNRKLSNTEIDLQLEQQFSRILQCNIQIKQQCSVNSSQQTATTINGSITNIPLNKYHKEQVTIYQKNGWMKRVNNLIQSGNNSYETITSQHDGNQMFSDEYTLKDEKLDLLGTMGKQIKGSIIDQH